MTRQPTSAALAAIAAAYATLRADAPEPAASRPVSRWALAVRAPIDRGSPAIAPGPSRWARAGRCDG